jgi:uncharacterized protein YcnI
MAQLPKHIDTWEVDTWEVPKSGTATASNTVNVTVSLINDILRNQNLLGKQVWFKKAVIQATAELEGSVIVAGIRKTFHCLSPNFVDVVQFDSPKPFVDDIIVQVTETLAATPKYIIHLYGLRSM